jgi:exodeoxyribonuclease V gamma subunit
MAGLFLYTSNRMEILAEHLAQIIRTPLPSPLSPEIVVVQSRGMERWISMALAEFNGINANCSFPFPNAFLESIFKKIQPDLPEISPFDPANLTFRLMRIIPTCLNLKGFESLKSYLADDNRQLKLFQLSGKIADLFDQYLVFRPELIFEWEEKKEKQKPPHIWQARLWRELVGEIGNRHRAWLRKKLFRQIKHLKTDISSFPARVSIFGISYLPLFHLEAFAELSRLIEINFFIVDPCKEYWADIVSDQEIKKIRQKDPRVAENIEWYHLEKGNRLLASMGIQGRHFFDLITGFDCEIYEQFEEPEAGNMLGRLQSDILNLRDREGLEVYGIEKSEDLPAELDDGYSCIAGHDTSLQIHSCHSPMREIEVLHDNLLAMFEEDPALLPKDIMVMTPDIETYAPFVHAVFDAQNDETLRIPFRIADQSSRRENRMIEGFLALLDLADSRFGAVQVFRLLEYSGIKERFGLVESDLKIIERWIKDTHIRWGIDENSRIEAGLPGYPENTWRAGLERLLLGYAMPGDNRLTFKGIFPFDNVEGSDVQVLGRFIEFVDRLFSWSTTLAEPRKLGEWQKTLLALIDQFLRPDDHSEVELQVLRQALDELGGKQVYADYPDVIDPQVIRSYLNAYLEQSNYGSGFLTGGITFGAMLPMRSIPFKVICLIGLNNDAFPRDHQPLNFDLMAQHPRTGDRSRRNDDKYLFLESIISARQRFYISYVGQSIQDNSPIPPSVLVSELLDTLEKSFESPDANILEQILTQHRLQQFSAWYFKDSSELFSYSAENMLAAAGAHEKKEPLPFFDRRLPMTTEETEKWKKIDPDSLCLFFSNPARYLVQRRLGIKLENAVLLSEERENFELHPLERYLVGQDMVKSLVAGGSLKEFKPIQKAIGQLPHGHVGDYYYADMTIEVQNFVRQVEKFTAARARESIDIDFETADFDVNGRLSIVSDLGCVRIRYGRQRVNDLLEAWIYHLLYCHTAPAEYQRDSYLICKDAAVQFEPLTDSLSILKTLLLIYRQGLEIPIHFFPKSSFEYADSVLRKLKTESTALLRAKKKWVGSDFAKIYRGESQDPYFDLCFRQFDPLDKQFQEIAIKVFEPLLAHCREIKL